MKINRMVNGRMYDFELDEDEMQSAYEEQREIVLTEKAREKVRDYIDYNDIEDADVYEIDYESIALDFIDNRSDDEADDNVWESVISSYV